MAKTQKSPNRALQQSIIRLARLHFLMLIAYALSIVIFDSWNLIPLEGIQLRWIMAGTLLALNTVIWYIARFDSRGPLYHRLLLLVLVVIDIVFAAVNVYLERGMASKSVALFMIPLAVAAVSYSRPAIVAAASLSVAAYGVAVTKYFTDHYGEGYKVELYGILFLYTALIYLTAALLWELVRPKNP